MRKCGSLDMRQRRWIHIRHSDPDKMSVLARLCHLQICTGWHAALLSFSAKHRLQIISERFKCPALTAAYCLLKNLSTVGLSGYLFSLQTGFSTHSWIRYKPMEKRTANETLEYTCGVWRGITRFKTDLGYLPDTEVCVWSFSAQLGGKYRWMFGQEPGFSAGRCAKECIWLRFSAVLFLKRGKMCWNRKREIPLELARPKRMDTFSFTKVGEGLKTMA